MYSVQKSNHASSYEATYSSAIVCGAPSADPTDRDTGHSNPSSVFYLETSPDPPLQLDGS